VSSGLELAVIGNCVIAALVDINARISWMCWPRLDGDPVFCALLDGEDPQDGFLDVELVRRARSEQRYLHNTAILETVQTDEAGNALRIVDFVPRFKRFGRIIRQPMLIRQIVPVSGRPLLRIRMRPRARYGAERPQRRYGSNHLGYLAGDLSLRLTTDAPLAYLAEEAPFLLDRPLTLILGPDETVPEAPDAIGRDFFDQTRFYWLEWSRYLNVPFEWQDAVIRAAITLKLSAFEETGGIVAALTTSIPEAADSGRNWDYRYCWLRDAFFTVNALNRLGATRTMEEYFRFISNVCALAPGGELRPVYPIVPSLPMPERIATDLAGFRGMGPVRIGNQAAEQVQNDTYGSVVLAGAQLFYDRRLPEPAGEELFRQLEILGEQAERVALLPDAGLWEYRERTRVHTFSAVMCWAGLDRLGRIARRLGLAAEATRWAERAQKLHGVIDRHAFRPELNSFVESFGGDGMDASLLLLPELGFVEPRDPRFLGTLTEVERRLRRDGLVLRYDMPDDFGLPDTAFLVCSFWYVDALAQVGRVEEARALFEQILARRNHVGLLSEDLDFRTGRMWGNFPQTYSHVGLILSAMRLSQSWEAGIWRA